MTTLRDEPQEIEIRGEHILCDGAVVARFEPGAEGFLRRRFEDWLTDGGNPRHVQPDLERAFDEGHKEGAAAALEEVNEEAVEDAKAGGIAEGRKEALTLTREIAEGCLCAAAAEGLTRALKRAVEEKDWKLP